MVFDCFENVTWKQHKFHKLEQIHNLQLLTTDKYHYFKTEAAMTSGIINIIICEFETVATVRNTTSDNIYIEIG